MTTLPLSPPIVYVVDDDVSIRESLSSLLRAEGLGVEVFASALDFLALDHPKALACLVLDVRMPGLDGLSLQEELHRRGWELPVIFITGHGDVPDVVRAMKAGAMDFLKKPFDSVALLQAITSALSRVTHAFYEKQASANLQARYDHLTPREKEVLTLLVQGKQNKVIAYQLGIAESTVKVHRHHVMAKMRLRSLPELALVMQRIKT